MRAAAGQIGGLPGPLNRSRLRSLRQSGGTAAGHRFVPLAGALDRLNFPVALVDTVCSVHAWPTGTPARSSTWRWAAPGPGTPQAFGGNWWHRSADRNRRQTVGNLKSRGGAWTPSALPIAVNGETPDFVLLCVGIPSAPGLSAELRKFYRAVDENLAGVVITDAEARIEYANPQACEILGCSPVELIHRDVH